MTHQITHFGTLYAESLLMNVKHVFLTITQGGLKMIGKDFTDKQRQKFLHQAVGAILLSGSLS